MIKDLIERKSTKKVFENIYNKNIWGGNKGEIYSGDGSHDKYIIEPYVDIISQYLKTQNKPTLVDLGCGDFNVGKRFIEFCGKYICVDIVPKVVDKLKSSEFPSCVKFLCLDIIKDQLPSGDICFIRQVLQHLSNKEILEILPKLKQYKELFITEHYFGNKNFNEDLTPGHSSRIRENSGVFLDKPPFSIPFMKLILEIPGGNDQGYIRTYKVELYGS